MGDVVSFALPDGGSVLVQPVGDEEFGLEEIAVSGGAVIRRAQEGFGEALEGIRRMVSEAHARLSSVDVPPKRLELEFGVTLSAETGAVLAKASGEAHLVVRAVWER